MANGNGKMVLNKALINGEWVSAIGGGEFVVYDPATGEEVGRVPDMGREETLKCIEAAQVAQASWGKTTLKHRSALIKNLFETVNKHVNELSELVTRECGKTLAESQGEVVKGNSFFEWFSEEAKRVKGDAVTAPHKDNCRMLFVKQPAGVTGIITPWNFPFSAIARKAGAALAAGCCIIIKPAEDTPLAALAMGKLAKEAGFPPGVFNVITCSRARADEIGTALCESKIVRKISFTGSTVVGKRLFSLSGSSITRLALELGGNSPFIVFPSADLDRAVAGLMANKFRNSGQTCISANRIYVHKDVYEEFCDKALVKIKALKPGPGMKEGTTLGPLINQKAIDKVKAHVADAIKLGAEVVTGGEPDTALGPNFFQPTLLVNVSHDALLNNEETFGPVAAIIKFEDESEIIKMANRVDVGLAAYVFTQDMAQLFRVSESLEVGMVGANEGSITTEITPFGGIKESGFGREGSVYGIEEFQDIKMINISL